MSSSKVAAVRAMTPRALSDWAGFACYTLIAVLVVANSPELGLLLLPVFLHESMIAASFLLRRPLRARLPGWRPRLAAYTGTFLIPAFLELAAVVQPQWTANTASVAFRNYGAALWLAGSLLSVWTVWRLRNSFSVEPQARALVTSGPYRFVRHPVYGSYLLQYGGILLMHATPVFAAVLLMWFAATLARVHYEEKVLLATFPGYADYKQKVGVFVPRFLARSKPPEVLGAAARARAAGSRRG